MSVLDIILNKSKPTTSDNLVQKPKCHSGIALLPRNLTPSQQTTSCHRRNTTPKLTNNMQLTTTTYQASTPEIVPLIRSSDATSTFFCHLLPFPLPRLSLVHHRCLMENRDVYSVPPPALVRIKEMLIPGPLYDDGEYQDAEHS
jgi:hypothetical protein